MLRLPGHIPVVTVFSRWESRANRVPEKLCDSLERLGVRFSVLGAEARIQSAAEVIALLADNDIILIDDGVVDSPACLFFSEDEKAVEPSDRHIFRCREESEIQSCAAALQSWHVQCSAATPVSGAVLIGGKSSRMGRPKHLIEDKNGVTWLERTIKTLGSVTADSVISGSGMVPESLKTVPRIEDISGIQGPLAGIGALFSSRPFTSWLVTACDMPHLTKAALDWLLEQRQPDYCGVVPVNPRTGRSEPLLAWYDYRCGPVIDGLIRSGVRNVSGLCRHDRILEPLIPEQLADNWRNINYFEDVEPG